MDQHLHDDLLAFVPSLTRHAKSLASSDEMAGEQVRLCLELLAVQSDRLRGRDTRTDLFRAFHDLWSPDRRRHPDNKVIGFSKSIEMTASNDRVNLEECVLQLVYVERFSQPSVAEILSIDQRRVAEILLAKRRRSNLPIHASALIIEDDSLMAKHLNEIAQELGLTVIHVADGVESAVCAALDKQPAVVLIDVQLRKGESGLTAARAILLRRRVPVIFVTGYPWMLESDDDLNPAFVVAKPFRPHTLKAKIATALDLYSEPERAEVHHAQLLTKIRQLSGQGSAAAAYLN